MRKITGLLLALLSMHAVYAQRTITGTVVDEVSHAPMAGASVFITNTSRGTVSDSKGAFELINVPEGQYDLIISMVGYETIVHSFNSSRLPLRMRAEMTAKVAELKNVTIESYIEDGWDRWGKAFLEAFIGTTPNAQHCKIKNTKDIRFRYYKKSNRLEAIADKPLVVENKALGYRIQYQLEQFEINFSQQSSMFTGYTLFTSLGKHPTSSKGRWDRNRATAYKGSMMHFMRCLFTDKLKEEQFSVARMKRVKNLEKERVRKIYKPVMPGIHINGPSGQTSSLVVDTTKSQDSVNYYMSVLRQPDHTDQYSDKPLTLDSLLLRTEAGMKVLYWTDYLFINYSAKPEQAYLDNMFLQRKPALQQSRIFLKEGSPIAVEANGNYYPPQDVYALGYWSWTEKVANMLPVDYEPEP